MRKITALSDGNESCDSALSEEAPCGVHRGAVDCRAERIWYGCYISCGNPGTHGNAGNVESVKLLRGRRAFVDLCCTDAAPLQAVLEAGSLAVAGSPALVGLNTSPAGPASQADMRQQQR